MSGGAGARPRQARRAKLEDGYDKRIKYHLVHCFLLLFFSNESDPASRHADRSAIGVVTAGLFHGEICIKQPAPGFKGSFLSLLQGLCRQLYIPVRI